MEVKNPALVAVVQSSSERDHHAETGNERFLRLDLPWVTFEFFDEHSLADFQVGLASQRYSAVVIASNALHNPAVLSQLGHRESTEELAAAWEAGLGIVLLQQFAPLGAERSCMLLPPTHQVDYVGTVRRDLTPENLLVAPAFRSACDAIGGSDATATPVFSELEGCFGHRPAAIWSMLRPLQGNVWTVPVALKERNGVETPLIMTSRSSRSRVLTSAIPLDWLEDTRPLAYSIARAVRPRGTMYLRPPGESIREPAIETLLSMGSERGGHVTHVDAVDPAHEIVMNPHFKHFSHLVLSDAWSWQDVGDDVGQTLRKRLENGGSFSAMLNSTGQERVLVRSQERPAYLRITEQFARWLDLHMARFDDAPTTAVRALAVAADAVEQAVSDPDEIPGNLTKANLRQLLTPYLHSRLQGTSCVDDLVMPTAAAASTMALLDFDKSDRQPLLEWITEHLGENGPVARAQAELWLAELGPPSPCVDGQVLPSSIAGVYSDLLATRTGGLKQAAGDRAVQLLRDPATPELRRAIVADALTASATREELKRLAPASPLLRADFASALKMPAPPLETVCLQMAALARLESVQALSVGIGDGARLSSQSPTSVDVDASVRNQALLERASRHEAETKVRDWESRFRALDAFASRLAFLVVLSLLLVASGAILGVWYFERPDLEVWLGITGITASALMLVLHWLTGRLKQFGCAPNRLNAVKGFLSKSE
jgi:hypothetical protein